MRGYTSRDGRPWEVTCPVAAVQCVGMGRGVEPELGDHAVARRLRHLHRSVPVTRPSHLRGTPSASFGRDRIRHPVRATIVLLRRDERMIRSFHRFSVVVSAISLVPYFSPLFIQLGT